MPHGACLDSECGRYYVCRLVGAFQFGFQSLEIGDEDRAAVDVDEAGGLKAAEIAGDEFADGTNLCGELLVAGGKENLGSGGSCAAFPLGTAEEEGGEAMANGGEGKFLDDSDQAAEASSDDAQNLQADLRVGETEGLEILFADEEQSGVVDGGDRCGIVAAIEDREFSDRTARAVDIEDLLASVDGSFEDANVPGFDDVEPGAGLSFREYDFSSGEGAGDGSLSEEDEFGVGESGKDGDLREDGVRLLRHRSIVRLVRGGPDLVEDYAEHEDEIGAKGPEEDGLDGRELAARDVMLFFGGNDLVGFEGGDDGGDDFAADVGVVICGHRIGLMGLTAFGKIPERRSRAAFFGKS